MAHRVAYFNGQWVDDRTLVAPVGDLGFTMGVTVTERMRTFAGAPFCVDRHLRRLERSIEIIGLDGPSLVAEVADAVDAFAQRLAGWREPGDDWAIVAFVTPGDGSTPTRCVHGMPLEFAAWARQYTEGVALRISSHRQTPPECWPAELKCRSRMHYYLADQEARRLEPGARALLLDHDGFVGEASTANVLMYRGAEGIVSPPMAKVLPGVTVGVTRELATVEGIPFVERDIAPEELTSADEVWLSSTSVCLLPATHIDGRPVGAGAPGPVYARMLATWGEHVGLDVAAQAALRASTATRSSS